MVLQENYPSISFITGLWWILKCTSCNKLGYQQTVHIPSLFASTEYVLRLYINHWKVGLQRSNSKSAYSVDLQKCIVDSAQDKPANPISKKSKGHTLSLMMIFQPLQRKPTCHKALPTSILQERSVSKPRHQSHLLSQPIQKSPHSKSYYKSFALSRLLILQLLRLY